MKRKFFTLVVVLLALAGFQAKAADPIKVGIQTGNFATPTYYGNGGSATGYQDERGGYAGKVSNVPNKLTFNGTNFVVAKAATPDTKAGSADLITVANPSANFITFTSVNGTTLSLKDPGGVWQSQFVVFRQAGDAFRVPDYYKTDQGAALANAGFVITPQLLNGGVFEGFIAVQAGGYVDDANLLIVVHDKDGVLSLMKYSTYVASLNGDLTKASNLYHPLYVKTKLRAGHWATPKDFADLNCKFTQFKLPDGTFLEAPIAEYQYGLSTDGKTYSTFTPKQVDYVKDGDANGGLTNVTNNILSHTETGGSITRRFTGIDANNVSKYYGCMPFNNDSVIPLFVLASPEKDCKVLSVSRINNLKNQSEQNGGFANKLELRDYGKYYSWNTTTSKYEPHTAPQGNLNTANDILWDQYTSLQKFAIWIDADGYMTLYPAASYFWEYGKPKETQTPDKILPNSVLIYNDINIHFATDVNAVNNKSWGVQIGWWNGRLTDGTTPSYVGTIPSDLQNQSWTDYQARKYAPVCNEGTPLTGRFYFLQVNGMDTTGIWKADYINANPKAAINANEDPVNNKGTGYQFGREYVLSTTLAFGDKYLVIVPKEKNIGASQSAGEYWRLPYDSVNMAAHWEIQPVAGGGYRLINMLGDTLKYNVPAAGTQADLPLPGGWQSLNWAIPGDPAAVANAPAQKYFGRPEVEGTLPANWFAPRVTASNATTCDVWNIHQMKGSSVFYMEMACGVASQTYLVPNTSNGAYNGWYSNFTSLVAGKNTTSGTPYWYYQKNVSVKAEAGGLASEAGNIASCGGMALSMQEIYYVPQHGPFYPGEPMNAVTNTNDPNFTKQDSLDAYTFLEGNYDLREAKQVDNGLRLAAVPVSINDGTSKTVNAAALVASDGVQVLQFIPMSGKDAQKRTAEITKFKGLESDVSVMSGIDTLYGETYKWYLVKNNKTGKYLTFDTLNLAAQTNRMKVGFIFEADLINATPVRLYQPLVGDKNLNNFLIQFYLPEYTYLYDKVNKTQPAVAFRNTFPNIESNSLTAPAIYGGGEVCFATLAGQSNYIFGARAYSSTIPGTRFTPVGNPITLDCAPQFIDPKWMGDNRLLSLPLKNQVWVQDAAIPAWIAYGSNHRGIMSRDVANQTTLTHTYVTSIKVYSSGPYAEANAKVAIPRNYYNTSPGPAKGDTTWVGSATSNIHNINPDATVNGGIDKGFNRDLEVPLYFVQNDENPNLYLTVVPNTAMFSQGTTPSDVSGIRLDWQPRFTWDQTFYDTYGFDRQALQLFAISGCKDVKDGWYGKFIYLPLASYKVEDHKTGTIVQTQSGATAETNDIFYNWNLGKAALFADGNDVQGCWRISQWNAPQLLTNDLVVMTANAENNAGLAPLEFKLAKLDYLQPKCDYQLVQNTSNYGTDKGKYYTFGGTVTPPTNAAPIWYTNQLQAHWQINYDATGLATFAPELKDVYGTAISKTAAGDYKQTQLAGEYYFVKQIATNQYRVINVAGYNAGNFRATFDTLTITCVDHTVPFYDLEADAGFNLMNKLAILETPFTDRCITYKAGTEVTKIYRGGKMIGYQTYLNQVGDNFKNADYLTVYKENRRYLAANHMIPYYSFSITKDGIEYFLNVDKAGANVNRVDSVYWTVLDDASRGKLLDWENNTNFLPTYKFCLPYQLNADGSMKDKVKYGDTTYPPVYLQTLDLAINDYPDLVVVGDASKYAAPRNLWDAIVPANRAYTLKWNIYTVDYSLIDPMKVTAWIFGGQVPAGDLWVPIGDAIKNGSKDGVITNNALNGKSFLDQTGKTPVNYGTLTTVDLNNIKVEYEGDTLIGSYAQRPIWYYRVNVNGKYLTDATPKDPYSAYYYPFYGKQYPYGYFDAKLADYATYVNEGIKADQGFIQTFGFRYVTNSGDPDQRFYIVSNANYRNKPTKENEFRFLAQINDQLVFVTDPTYALIFQWGSVSKDGSYTDIQVVGRAGIYGVEGGVKFLSTSGKADIYSIDGRLIKSVILTGNEQTIAVPRGIAIVKAGSNVVKVVVQ